MKSNTTLKDLAVDSITEDKPNQKLHLPEADLELAFNSADQEFSVTLKSCSQQTNLAHWSDSQASGLKKIKHQGYKVHIEGAADSCRVRLYEQSLLSTLKRFLKVETPLEITCSQDKAANKTIKFHIQ